MDDLKQQIMLLPRHELTQLAIWINGAEMPRREREEAKLEGMTELIKAMPDAPKPLTVEDVEQVATPEVLDGIPDWVNPQNDHLKMYLPNAIVRHRGKLWVSKLARINEYEPGTTPPELRIWVEWEPEPVEPAEPAPMEPVEPVEPEASPVEEPAESAEQETPAPTAPPFTQPTGAHDAYKIGDQVLFEGNIWESTANNNSYSPAVYPAWWRKIS